MFTEGFDPNFGARPLKRSIQKLVQDPLAHRFTASKHVGEKEPAKAGR